MFSWFLKLIDAGVECQFRKDPTGQLVFLPFGPRKQAYFVDSQSDAEKTRAFLRMYRSATLLMTWLYIAGSYILSHYLISYPGAGAIPLQVRVQRAVWPASAYLILTIVFVLALWGVYKRTIVALIGPMRKVGPELTNQLVWTSPRSLRLQLLCLGAAFILMGLAFFAVLQHRHLKPQTRPVCAPHAEDNSRAQVPPCG